MIEWGIIVGGFVFCESCAAIIGKSPIVRDGGWPSAAYSVCFFASLGVCWLAGGITLKLLGKL